MRKTIYGLTGDFLKLFNPLKGELLVFLLAYLKPSKLIVPMNKLLTRFSVIAFLVILSTFIILVILLNLQIIPKADPAKADTQQGTGSLLDLILSSDMAVGCLSGLISGLVVAGLLGAFRYLFEYKIKPLLKPTESYDLTDTWIEQYTPLLKGEAEDMQEQSCSLEIQHTAGVITGTATFADNDFGVRKMFILLSLKTQ